MLLLLHVVEAMPEAKLHPIINLKIRSPSDKTIRNQRLLNQISGKGTETSNRQYEMLGLRIQMSGNTWSVN